MTVLSSEESEIVGVVSRFVDEDVRPVLCDLEHRDEHLDALIEQMNVLDRARLASMFVRATLCVIADPIVRAHRRFVSRCSIAGASGLLEFSSSIAEHLVRKELGLRMPA